MSGDGWLGCSLDLPGRQRLVGEVMRDDMLMRFPIPVTVGLSMADVPPDGTARDEALDLARSIVRLPRVQLGHCAGGPVSAMLAAIEAGDRLLPPEGRGTEVVLWSDAMRPDAAMLEACLGRGLEALGGGGSRCDGDWPSVSGFAPMGHWIDGRRLVAAAAVGEDAKAGPWQGHHAGLRNIIETFRRGEAARRLAAIHINGHWRSGERQAALRAAQDVVAWCLGQRLCWVTAAEYARQVRGFGAARLGRTDTGWWIEPAGCPTVRFDAEPRDPDPLSSPGLLGFCRRGDTVYCSLDTTRPRCEIYFRPVVNARPFLVSSTAALRRITATDRSWRAEVRRYAPGALELAGCPAGAKLAVRCGTSSSAPLVNERGRAIIPLAEGQGEWTEIEVVMPHGEARRHLHRSGSGADRGF
jgi:hypothetical protein